MAKTETGQPGPWTYHIGLDYTEFYDVNSDEIFRIGYAMNEALACLIVAAPEMLKALKAVMGLVDTGFLIRDISHDGEPGYAMRMLEPVRQLRNAATLIAEAEGE